MKAFFYGDEDGLLGYIVMKGDPPQNFTFGDRYFELGHHQPQTIVDGVDEWTGYIYNEIHVLNVDQIVEICICCGRVSSRTWWKCCPEHTSERGIDVICQVCVEHLHPDDDEFERAG